MDLPTQCSKVGNEIITLVLDGPHTEISKLLHPMLSEIGFCVYVDIWELRSVLYLDLGDGYMSVCLCKKKKPSIVHLRSNYFSCVKIRTFYILLYISYTLPKKKKTEKKKRKFCKL